MIKFFGESPRYILFTDGANGVIIDKYTNMVDEVGSLGLLASALPWKKVDHKIDQAHYDLAAGALADLEVKVITASGRMYTIPKGVQAEAKKALEWRKEHKRGGTPVGVNTARTLANGGQIGIEKVRHIAKYFPRHEIDKKAKGYEPGEDGFPSRGRIAWALWGGDAGWRWAKAIVERENKKVIRADGYIIEHDGSSFEDYEAPSMYDADIDFFSDENSVFIARTHDDGSGIDRLYTVNENGGSLVWDDGQWDDLSLGDNVDIYSIDRALDSEIEDDTEYSHIIIDTASALIASAYLQTLPFTPVSIDNINEEEAALVASALNDIDWAIIDAITAAGEEGLEGDSTPGEYTPEERSKKARSQVRDKTGKFAAKGSRVVVGGDSSKRGNITKINPASQSVTVQLDSGESVDVPANQTEKEEAFTPQTMQAPPAQERLDVSGILGQPRQPINNPKAIIPNALPALTSDQLGQMLADFPAWVKSQRDFAEKNRYTSPNKEQVDKQIQDRRKQTEKAFGEKLITTDLKQHPLFKNLFKKNPKYNLYYDYKFTASGAVVSALETAKPVTPQTSDVQPLYMAIVSPEDPSAVFDLIAVVPASETSTSPATFKREDAKWVPDTQILSDLMSPTPPPVVPLDGDNLVDVLEQVDKTSAPAAAADNSKPTEPLAAAGGIDRNRGNAEKLRRYWTIGRGAVKIRWNTPGDWTRCYRQLVKYMGPRAKGYCSLRHKEMTGVWPGSKYNVGKKKRNVRASGLFEINVPSEEQVLNALYLQARINDARERVLLAGGATATEGANFTIPLVIPEDIESGDGRKFRKGSIEVRDLPLPLLWQVKTADGHDGSFVVGRIDHMERTENGIGNAYGVFDVSAYGREAERMVRDGFIRGVSADLDKFEASEGESDDDVEAAKKEDKKKKIGGGKIDIDKARVMAVTIVPKPAFQECRIYLENTDAGASQEEDMLNVPDGIYVEDMEGAEAQSIVACGMVAGAIPDVPPAEWLQNPKLTGPTPLTIGDDGRVFGHIAAWHVNHIGMTAGTKPPRSKSKYAYFHTGVLRADDSKDYPVGQLTLAGGHASLEASALDAARHYDDTGSAIADVHAGEDAYGIWVAGALRSSATPEQIRALRASAPSGDWRPVNGALELVAVCQVNVPGFPIARARVASGQVYALVAAGAQVLAKMKSDPLTELAQRVETLEAKKGQELSTKAEAARQKIAAVKTEQQATLSAKAAELSMRVLGPKIEEQKEVDASIDSDELQARIASAAAEAQLANISMRARKRLAKEGKALPDGSYPIRNASDLRNAIQSYGRSKPGDRAKVRRHVVKRARALGKTEMIPENWKTASMIAEDIADIRAQVASAKATLDANIAEITES
jgi:hypothetical protein